MSDFSIRISTVASQRVGASAAPSTPGMMNPPTLTPDGATALTIGLAQPPASNGAPIESYDLRHSTDTVTWTELLDVSATTSLSGLALGTTYHVQNRAENANGVGPWSLASSFVTAASASVPSPFAPTEWTLSDNGTGGDMTITVLAMPSDGGAPILDLEYQVNGGGWVTLGGQGLGSYQFVFLGIGVPIDVAIRAVNAVGPGPASDIKTETPTNSITVPGQMAAPVVTAIGTDSISVDRATAPSDGGSVILFYDLRYSTDGTNWTEMSAVADPQSVTGLLPDTTYLVQTSAVNGIGLGPWSASGSAATDPLPTAPHQMGPPTLSFSGADLSVDLASAPNDGGSPITSFDLRYSLDEIAWTELTAVSDPEILTGLSAGVAYFVQTRAVNVLGAGDWSLSASATIGAPLAMLAPVVSEVSTSELSVDRAAAPNDNGSAITSYDLRYSTDEATWTIVTGIADPEALTGLLEGVTYFVQTRALNAVGDGIWSPSGSGTTTLLAPVASGTLSGLDYLRGVDPGALDVAGLFTGAQLTFDLDPSSDPLPDGRTLGPGGSETGAPISTTDPGMPLQIVYRATNAAGVATISTNVSVSAPILQDLAFVGNEVMFSTDTDSGNVFLWFGSVPNPTDAEIETGSGVAHLASTSFPVSGAGEFTAAFDLTQFIGQSGFLYAMQVAGSGAYSVPLFDEITVVASAPAAFQPADWSVADAGTGGALDVTIVTLPDDGGAPLTALEYRVDGGAWSDLGGLTTGTYQITGLPSGTSVDLTLRAVNVSGPGTESDTKTISASSGSGAAFVGREITESIGVSDTLVANLPTGVVVGEVLIAHFVSDLAVTLSTPAGWTLIAYDVRNAAVTGAWFGKVASGSDAFSTTLSEPTECMVCVERYSGVSNFSGTAVNATSTNSAPPLHTPASTGRIWIAAAAQDSLDPVGAGPAGYANFEQRQHADGTTACTLAMANLAADLASEQPGVFTRGESGGIEENVTATIALW